MSAHDEFVVQLMVDKGLIPRESVVQARAVLRESDLSSATVRKVSDVLIEQGVLRPGEMLRVLGEEFSMPIVDLIRHRPHPSALDSVPRELAERYHVIPIELNGLSLKIAISDPLDTDTVDSLTHVLQRPVEAVLALPEEIDAAIQRHYNSATTGETVQSFLKELSPEEQAAAIDPRRGGGRGGGGDRRGYRDRGGCSRSSGSCR